MAPFVGEIAAAFARFAQAHIERLDLVGRLYGLAYLADKWGRVN